MTEGNDNSIQADAEREVVGAQASGTPPDAVKRQRKRRSYLRGAIPFGVGVAVEFFLTAADKQFRWGIPLGIVATLVAVWGFFDLFGTFDPPSDPAKPPAKSRQVVRAGIAGTLVAVWRGLDLFGTVDDPPPDDVASRVKLRDLSRTLVVVIGLLVGVLVLLGLAVAGYMQPVVSALLIPLAFFGLIVAVYRFGEKLGPWSRDREGARPLHERHGFWVVSFGTLLYLPFLGSYSLSDPWETHYGEVAREVLSRNDWISTWWAQDGWFWSKPVLNFWTEALSMGLLGAGYQPDQMLSAATVGRVPWPEWAIRMPVFIFTIVSLYLIYKGVAQVFGRRAGLIGAMILATCPHWFFIAHQTMTDFPFVGSMTAAMGLLLWGIHVDPQQRVRVYQVDVGKSSFRLSAYHLVIGVILAVALPQIIYLLTRNVDLQLSQAPYGFRWHADVFESGSAGNCGLPGNQACIRTLPANRLIQPWIQALIWTAATALFLSLNRGERRLSRLLFIGAWFFAALSTMGKGPAGFLLPALCAGAYVFAAKKWTRLLDFEFLSGLLVILAVALPWYVAMYMRHGEPFTDRLLFHDMWKRAMVHVHDTNAGDDVSFRYYIWQLGYALFPWVGVVPAGLVLWMRGHKNPARADASVFLGMWFLFAFALFTAMLTKFHHYIFPAVPPAAMLTGVVLDRLIGDRSVCRPRALPGYLAAMAGGMGLLVYGVFRFFPGMLMGFKPETGDPRTPVLWIGFTSVALGALLVWAGIRLFGPSGQDQPSEPGDAQRSGLRRTVLGAGIAFVGLVVGVLLSALLHSVAIGVVVGAGLVLGGLWMFLRGVAERSGGWRLAKIPLPPPSKDPTEDALLGATALSAAFVVALVGRDLAIDQGDGQGRLIELFTYNYKRVWPESLEFSGMLAAFAVVGTALMVLLLFRRIRHHVVVASLALGAWWALWALDIYLVEVAPHWGQRETILAYYQHRAGPQEPIVAYQMNWKGENFYTSNRIPAFVSSGETFKSWIKKERENGTTTFYFVTEHGRKRSLENELGKDIKQVEAITSKQLNNKFGLFRATFPPG